MPDYEARVCVDSFPPREVLEAAGRREISLMAYYGSHLRELRNLQPSWGCQPPIPERTAQQNKAKDQVSRDK